MTMAEKLTAIAENEQKVFNAGKQAEYDAFWDAYQNAGKRVDYERAFGGAGWTATTFKPKYAMQPTNASSMFRFNRLSVDLVELLKAIDVTIDFSLATSVSELFMNSMFTHIGVVDVTSAVSLQNAFNNTQAVTIDKLILRDDGTNTFISAFNNSSKLENIIIEGAIGNNISFSVCPLTHDSLMSIINHLQAKSSGSFVLTLGTDNLAKLTDTEKAVASGKGWTLA